jgi:hypothetical protein
MKTGLPVSLCALAAVLSAGPIESRAQGSMLDSLGIASRGTSRPFCYTNKAGAFFYGETNAPGAPGWEGFTVEGHTYLRDYVLELDGVPVDRRSALSTVFPDFIRREYPGGVVEEMMLADSIAAVIVTIRTPHPVEAAIIPIPGSGGSADVELKTGESSLSIARRNHMSRSAAENYPAWVTLYAPGFSPARRPSTRDGSFAPGALIAPKGKSHVIAIATGDTPDESLRLARFAERTRTELALRRRERM